MGEMSGIAYIDAENIENPLDLYYKWFNNYQQQGNEGMPMLNLATSSKSGQVSNRTLLIRDIKNGNFIILTCDGSKKANHFVENPNVAATIVFKYNQEGKNIAQQVRIEGIIEPLSKAETKPYFDSEPLYCKIRGHICEQDKEIDWNVLKKRHDDLLEEVRKGKQLECPDNVVGYRIVPSWMDFYYAYDTYIGDRVQFYKVGSGWTKKRVQA